MLVADAPAAPFKDGQAAPVLFCYISDSHDRLFLVSCSLRFSRKNPEQTTL